MKKILLAPTVIIVVLLWLEVFYAAELVMNKFLAIGASVGGVCLAYMVIAITICAIGELLKDVPEVLARSINSYKSEKGQICLREENIKKDIAKNEKLLMSIIKERGELSRIREKTKESSIIIATR